MRPIETAAALLLLTGCAKSTPEPEHGSEPPPAESAPPDTTPPPAEKRAEDHNLDETENMRGGGAEKPPADPVKEPLLQDVRKEDPANLLFEETVRANLETGIRLRIVVRKDGSFSIERGAGNKDGKLDEAQRKRFDAALKAAEVKAGLKGPTCAGLPRSNIEVRAKGKLASWADACAAVPSESLQKLVDVVHELVGLP
jgi:hypothetical protein